MSTITINKHCWILSFQPFFYTIFQPNSHIHPHTSIQFRSHLQRPETLRSESSCPNAPPTRPCTVATSKLHWSRRLEPQWSSVDEWMQRLHYRGYQKQGQTIPVQKQAKLRVISQELRSEWDEVRSWRWKCFLTKCQQPWKKATKTMSQGILASRWFFSILSLGSLQTLKERKSPWIWSKNTTKIWSWKLETPKTVHLGACIKKTSPQSHNRGPAKPGANAARQQRRRVWSPVIRAADLKENDPQVSLRNPSPRCPVNYWLMLSK